MLVLSIVCFLSYRSSAFPLFTTNFKRNDETDALRTASGWVSAPNFRGTFDIVLGCLTTLFLCAWTAYHPNIHAKAGWRQTTTRRIPWLLAAVFVPEVVLFCAWEQWWTARNLLHELNGSSLECASRDRSNLNPLTTAVDCAACTRRKEATSCLETQCFEHERIGEAAPQPLKVGPKASKATSLATSQELADDHLDEGIDNAKSWTIYHTFFAVSGGFAVDTSSFWREPRMTCTVAGVIELSKAGLLLRPNLDTITDKSKADTAAKVLVCIQASWFLVQCIARLIQKLPLTLLEIHVLSHIFCAFSMYFLWLNKPYDVGSPITLDSEEVIDLAALFALDARTWQWTHKDSYDERCSLSDGINLEQVDSAHDAPALFRTLHGTTSLAPELASQPWTSRLRHRLHMSKKATSTQNSWILPTHSTPPIIAATSSDIRRTNHLERANRALKRLKSLDKHFHFQTQDRPIRIIGPSNSATKEPSIQHSHIPQAIFRTRSRLLVPFRSNLRVDGLKYWSPSSSHSNSSSANFRKLHTKQILAVIALCTVYGGLHLAAWNAHFPTLIETWLWRGSGITIIALPVVLAMGMFGNPYHVLKKREDRWPWKFQFVRHCVNGMGWTLQITAFMVAMLLTVVYPVARVYVLVESFAGLRTPAAGTYVTVEWTGFVPHFG